MRDIYQPHYLYLLDSSFKETPFNITLNNPRQLYCGSSCKCIDSSLSRKNYERIKQLSINKIGNPSWTNLTKENMKVNKNTFYDKMIGDYTASDEIAKNEMAAELDQYFSSLFQETSILNSWKLSNYFHGIFQNGILYHLGQLKMVFQRSGTKVFITKHTDNIWIDNYFMPFILKSLTSRAVVKVHEENHKILHDFQYGSHLIITPKNSHLLKATISCLMALDCCLIIEDSPGKDVFLTSLIDGLLNGGFKDVHIIPVSFSFDYLPKDQSMEYLKNFVLGYKNFGSIRVDFDKLFDLKSFIDHLFLTNSLNREKFPRTVLALEVSNHTYVSSYRNQRIMAVPFVAFILAFSGKKTVGIEEVIDDMEYFLSLFQRRGIELGFSGHLKSVNKYAVEFLEKRKVLIRLKNNLIFVKTDLKPYFLKELYPVIWADILLYNSTSSMLSVKDINYFQNTFYEHKCFSQSLMIKRAIWLDSLIEVRLLKPCEDIEAVLYTSLDQLINEGSFHRMDFSAGIKKYRRIEGLIDDTPQRDEELKISTHARVAKTMSLYRNLVGDFLKHLYDLTNCLVEKLPIEEWMSESSISNEDKDRCIASFVRLGILEEKEEAMNVNKSWNNNSKLEQFRSSIYMYIK